MRKFILTILFTLVLSVSTYADKNDLVRGVSKLDTVKDAYWDQNILFVVVDNYSQNFKSFGYSICSGSMIYDVQKNYYIWFIRDNSEKLSGYNCSN